MRQEQRQYESKPYVAVRSEQLGNGYHYGIIPRTVNKLPDSFDPMLYNLHNPLAMSHFVYMKDEEWSHGGTNGGKALKMECKWRAILNIAEWENAVDIVGIDYFSRRPESNDMNDVYLRTKLRGTSHCGVLRN